MQSDLPQQHKLHVAIIMDGNGRWATRRGMARSAGHRAGVATVRRIVERAPDLGIGTLTVYAFSADNWRRPAEEVAALMWLLRAYLRSETRRFVESGARLSVIGRRDRLPMRLRHEIHHAERATAGGGRLHFRVALDYSARESILRAVAQCQPGPAPSVEQFTQLLAPGNAQGGAVDLLIRTGGEKRLSDFLLWECAYAELWFTDLMWPDFGPEQLAAALAEFRGRERRFGGLGPAVAEPIAQRSAGD